MTLINACDYCGIGKVESLIKSYPKNVYFSDDVDDVYDVLNAVNNEIVFDRKVWNDSNHQIYEIILNDFIKLEQLSNSPMFKIIKSKEDYFNNNYFALMNNEMYSKIRNISLDSLKKNISFAKEVNSSVFIVSSYISSLVPLICSIDFNIPPKRKKHKRKIISLLGRLEFPGISPELVKI